MKPLRFTDVLALRLAPGRRDALLARARLGTPHEIVRKWIDEAIERTPTDLEEMQRADEPAVEREPQECGDVRF